MKDWDDFFNADGPTLTWAPTKGEVLGAGDVGYTTGRSVFRRKGEDGKIVERRGQYLTVWRKQPDGSGKSSSTRARRCRSRPPSTAPLRDQLVVSVDVAGARFLELRGDLACEIDRRQTLAQTARS